MRMTGANPIGMRRRSNDYAPALQTATELDELSY
jgi:hypothetical protein